jgi:hypothetical protein
VLAGTESPEFQAILLQRNSFARDSVRNGRSASSSEYACVWRIRNQPEFRRFLKLGTIRRAPIGRCGICSAATSTFDLKPRPKAISKSARLRSDHHWLLHFSHGPARVLKSAIVLKPSTLLRFHQMQVKRKCRAIFSPKHIRRPGRKGPAQEIRDGVVEMKRCNPTWGCRRIAQQVSLAFGVEIDKDIVEGFSQSIFGRNRVRRDHPGSRSSGIRRIVCGVPTCFALNP